jgi:hypothetical protein
MRRVSERRRIGVRWTEPRYPAPDVAVTGGELDVIDAKSDLFRDGKERVDIEAVDTRCVSREDHRDVLGGYAPQQLTLSR